MQKTNFKTRLLALLTAVFMVVMCMPFAAFAASNGYDMAIVNLKWDDSQVKITDFGSFDNQDGL